MCLKKLISLSYRKEILPFHILNGAKNILVFLPIKSRSESSSFIPAIAHLRKFFASARLIGVMEECRVSFYEQSGLFDEIISYKSVPFFLSRQFFILRKKLRSIPSSMSIDFNLRTDLLSWIGASPLRVGAQSSPFINYEVKLVARDEAESALKLVQSICINR